MEILIKNLPTGDKKTSSLIEYLTLLKLDFSVQPELLQTDVMRSASSHDEKPVEVQLSEAELLEIAQRQWTACRKLEAVKTVMKLGYSLKDAKSYCELHFA